MREELEAYLRMLEADLEVEVDLHGGRTRLATDLRSLILYTGEELASLKTGGVTTVTETEVVYRYTV
jgi:hypothetical protein